jgi:hypothetical protein
MKLNTFWGLNGHGEKGQLNLKMPGHDLAERWDQCVWIFHTGYANATGKGKHILSKRYYGVWLLIISDNNSGHCVTIMLRMK